MCFVLTSTGFYHEILVHNDVISPTPILIYIGIDTPWSVEPMFKSYNLKVLHLYIDHYVLTLLFWGDTLFFPGQVLSSQL